MQKSGMRRWRELVAGVLGNMAQMSSSAQDPDRLGFGFWFFYFPTIDWGQFINLCFLVFYHGAYPQGRYKKMKISSQNILAIIIS